MEVRVRFEEKDATVRYLPGQVTLDQILKRYDSTPFGVTLAGQVVTIDHKEQVVVRGWAQRTEAQAAEPHEKVQDDARQPIKLYLETVVDKSSGVTADSEFSFADLADSGLAAHGGFEKTDAKAPATRTKLVIDRFAGSLYETVALKSSDSLVQVNYKITTTDPTGKQIETTGTLQVVVRTPPPKPTSAAMNSTGVALIDGKLDLKLGHLCDQRGCVEHFYNSLSAFSSVGGVDPHPGLEQPGATIYLRAGRAIDIWSLREGLRDRSVEITGIVPRELTGYRLWVELTRWESADASAEVQQCLNCRDAAVEAIEASALVNATRVSGGGISFTPKQDNMDLIKILDVIVNAGVAPQAVWLVPENVSMPKASPPQTIKPDIEPQPGVSPSHPVVEFEFAHKCDAGPTVLAMIGTPGWTSRRQYNSDELSIAYTAIGDRKHAGLTPLLNEFRSAGQIPQQVRLRGFGDLRIRLEFAHVCGDIVYSKPPKPKKKAGNEEAQDDDAEPAKPFVPKALHPAPSSNGRKAIQAAIESVPWIKDAVFFDYHTRFEFRGGPTKISLSFKPKGEDVVRLDQLIEILGRAGFPPKSVMVSRRFSGIAFTAPLPGELMLTDRDGQEKPLSSLKQPDRPLALAFVSLNCKRHKKYTADPEFYKHLSATIDKYKDRVDFVTVTANPDDKFEDVVAFLEKANLPIPLHDADGLIRSALNAQETPAPHLYIFDSNGLFRHAGDPHDHWGKADKEKDNYLVQALDVVLAGRYAENGATFLNKSLCNCSHPKCKCPKCGCGPSCRCLIKH